MDGFGDLKRFYYCHVKEKSVYENNINPVHNFVMIDIFCNGLMRIEKEIRLTFLQAIINRK